MRFKNCSSFGVLLIYLVQWSALLLFSDPWGPCYPSVEMSVMMPAYHMRSPHKENFSWTWSLSMEMRSPMLPYRVTMVFLLHLRLYRKREKWPWICFTANTPTAESLTRQMCLDCICGLDMIYKQVHQRETCSRIFKGGTYTTYLDAILLHGCNTYHQILQ